MRRLRVALSTGGGDAPGLNAVIRSAVLAGTALGWEMLGIKRGYAGLLGEDEIVQLSPESVRSTSYQQEGDWSSSRIQL